MTEQAAELAKDLASPDCEAADRARLERLRRSDGRFDVLHFEQVVAADEDDADGMLDPSTLLVVLEALARLTDGVAVDPQSGTFM